MGIVAKVNRARNVPCKMKIVTLGFVDTNVILRDVRTAVSPGKTVSSGKVTSPPLVSNAIVMHK